MTAISPTLLAFACACVVLAILLSPAMARVAAAFAFVAILWAGYHTFIRSTECPQIGGPCRAEMSATWASWCWSSANAAVLRESGRYYLVSDGQHDTRGTCFDVRFWESDN